MHLPDFPTKTGLAAFTSVTHYKGKIKQNKKQQKKTQYNKTPPKNQQCHRLPELFQNLFASAHHLYNSDNVYNAREDARTQNYSYNLITKLTEIGKKMKTFQSPILVFKVQGRTP